MNRKPKILSISLKLTALTLALLMLGSCAKSGTATDTQGADTSNTDQNKQNSVTIPEMPEYDFSSLDLSAYVTLPAGYIEKDYKEGLELLGEVTDADVEAEIRSSCLLQLAKYPETGAAGADAVLQDLDRVIMDYTGKLDGVAFQGGTATDTEHDISILHSSFIDGFDRGMLGMKEGETRDLDLKFPDNYQNSELAGKSVVFTVTVDKIIRPELPELTDALVTDNSDIFGSDVKSADEFKEKVKKSLNESNKAENNDKITEAVWQHLCNNSVFASLPEEQKKGYEDYYYSYYLAMAESNDTTIEALISQWGFLSLDAFKKEAVYDATAELVRQKLIVHSAAKDLGISVTDEQAKAQAEEDFKTYIEPNIMYYSMYYGISDLEGFIEYSGGIYGYKENLLLNTILKKIGKINEQ